uniref:MADF domain-containing protein n=1 Tax=Cacopsylla melanoneura TaxID=428564 RepID=A0A8D8XGD0_9HEMI
MANTPEELVEFTKNINECLDEAFETKLQNMRSAFRKELRKIKSSRPSGSGEESVHRSTLWYFDLLVFTKDQEVPTPSISNISPITPSSEKVRTLFFCCHIKY